MGVPVALVIAWSGTSAAQDLQTPPPPPNGGAQMQPVPDANQDKAEKEDSHLEIEWIWLNADTGFSYMDLKSAKLAIQPAGLPSVNVIDDTQTGLAYGFGGGVRLWFLTFGIRARNHTAMNLWQIDGEVAFHGRIGRIDPYLAGRFGYATVGKLDDAANVATGSPSAASVAVHGMNGGAAFGIDYYFSHLLSLGVEAAGDIVYLKRAATSAPTLTPQQQMVLTQAGQPNAQAQLQQAYAAEQSIVGFGAGLTLHLGVHF
jgi:hypothetical protein